MKMRANGGNDKLNHQRGGRKAMAGKGGACGERLAAWRRR